MPRIINAYATGNDSIADSLKSLGDSMFGNEAQKALIREHALKAARENTAAPAQAEAFRQNNATEMGAQSIMGGRSGADFNQYNLGRAGIAANGNVDDPALAVSQLAAGHGITATVTGQGRQLANTQAIEDKRTASTAATQLAIADRQNTQLQWNDDHTLVNLQGPDGRVQMVPKSQVAPLQAHGYTVVPTVDNVSARMMSPQASPAPIEPAAGIPPVVTSLPAQPLPGNVGPAQQDGMLNGTGSAAGAPPPHALPVAASNAPQPAVMPTTQSATAIPQSGRDEAYLSSLPPQTAAMVKAMVEGRQAFPAGFAMRSPMVLNLMAAAARYEPGFDATKFIERQNTARDFGTGGKSGQNIASINMALKHLDNFDKSIDALGNYTYMPGVANTVHATVAGQTDPNYQKNRATAAAAVEALAQELPRTFRGASGAEADVHRNLQSMDLNASPVALHAMAQQIARLIASRSESMTDNYNRAMNTNLRSAPLLSPDAQAIMARIGKLGGQSQSAPGTPASAAPVQVGDKAAYDALPPGTSYVAPDGSTRTKQ